MAAAIYMVAATLPVAVASAKPKSGCAGHRQGRRYV
jgi:hypothetical protein